MKRKTVARLSLYAGLALCAAGIQMRTVEAFVLRAETTAVLARWTGPPSDSARGALRAAIVDAVGPRKVVAPPNWLGWACLSAGGALLVHGGLQLRRKSGK